jgi:hypothetical protein
MLQLPYQADMRKRRNDANEANSGSLHLLLITHKAYLLISSGESQRALDLAELADIYQR